MIAPRLLIAGICLPFLFSGVAKLLDFDGAIAEFASFGFPVPALFAALTIALQLSASVASIAFALAFVAWWDWRPRERRSS
jgi:uncharacterized membrane protein YphA (DoxX/SURF4 family)